MCTSWQSHFVAQVLNFDANTRTVDSSATVVVVVVIIFCVKTKSDSSKIPDLIEPIRHRKEAFLLFERTVKYNRTARREEAAEYGIR